MALDRYLRTDIHATVDLGLEIVGRSILRARTHARISQRHLGRLAGVHQTTISRLETGTLRGLRLSKLATIVATLNGFPIIEDGRHEVLCDRYLQLLALAPPDTDIPLIVITEEGVDSRADRDRSG
ncbi:MAG TPA: helix-turn-helix transcriptional regulator [Candidatus Limnocylindrales bacterium]|jgi:transcriptional regulator with XRE-family HTH domain|nr:helix-turn-helix transcriptional regulator [Candidatus Limnocylindrales bacterium]